MMNNLTRSGSKRAWPSNPDFALAEGMYQIRKLQRRASMQETMTCGHPGRIEE